MLTIRPAAEVELELVLSVPSDTAYDLPAGRAKGEYRPQWTWLALNGDRPVTCSGSAPGCWWRTARSGGTNLPMAAAFRRAGYTGTERIRLDLV